MSLAPQACHSGAFGGLLPVVLCLGAPLAFLLLALPFPAILHDLLCGFAMLLCWSMLSRSSLQLQGRSAAEDLIMSILLVPVVCFTLS